MRCLWLFAVCGGCGLFEGVEEPFVDTPCRVGSQVDVTDPEQDVGFLAPLGERLTAIEGAFPVDVVQLEPDDGGPFGGTLTLSQSGVITAIEQSLSDGSTAETGSERCASYYRVPIDAALDLDGGLFHLAMPAELAVTDVSPAIRGGTTYTGDQGAWRDVDSVDLSTTLDLRFGFGSHFIDPQTVTLGIWFDDGVTAGGDVEFFGVLDAPDDEVDDGTQVAWVSLSFPPDDVAGQ